MTAVRHPAVAGTFYPADPAQLRAAVEGFVAAGSARDRGAGEPPPKAVVAPHAGYVYSGPIAGSVYARVARLRGTVTRVVLLGPAHRVPLRGLAVPSVDALETPLGPVPVDDAGRRSVLDLPQVTVDDGAHADEHSLEVHLPFLQVVLGDVTVVPLVAGLVAGEDVAEVLDVAWGGDETLVVVSTDLSHYLDYDTATRVDRETAAAVVARRAAEIGPHTACGAYPLRGLLVAAARRGLEVQLLDLRNSGDTAGPRDRVVGYGAFALAVA